MIFYLFFCCEIFADSNMIRLLFVHLSIIIVLHYMI